MAASQQTIETLQSLAGEYKYGFVTDIESDLAPKGLDDDTVRFISAKKFALYPPRRTTRSGCSTGG